MYDRDKTLRLSCSAYAFLFPDHPPLHQRTGTSYQATNQVSSGGPAIQRLKSRPEGCALYIPAIPPRLPPEALKLPGNAGTSHGGRALTGRARYRTMLTYMGS